MEMKKRDFLIAGATLGAGLVAKAAMAQDQPSASEFGSNSKSGAIVRNFAGNGKQTSMVDLNYKPKRLNKCIELWQAGCPIFYDTYAPSGIVDDAYATGKAMAKTYADAINYECEQGVFDMSNLRKFMQGLADGGPTKSGHRTPMVFASLPVTGRNRAYVEANSWVIAQVLAAGVQAIDICHARDPGAIEMVVASMRYPFHNVPNTPQLPIEGLRGNGSESFASHIWGITVNKYLHVADVWPLNPKGEICLGLKIEDHWAQTNAAKTLAVPGVAFAEWGGGDSTMSDVGLAAFPEDEPPRGAGGDEGGPSRMAQNPVLEKARLSVLAACKANNIKPLNMSNARSPLEAFKQGTMVIGAGNDEDAILECREYCKRTMPI
jgi:4-hydroxy-2-oxoheptanedioate aldolase